MNIMGVRELEARNAEANLRALRQMETKIVYCDECGEYLGDLVDGVLYKFGKVIKETHVCEGKGD